MTRLFLDTNIVVDVLERRAKSFAFHSIFVC